MGLVEGPGGLGQGGAAATLGEDSHDAEGKYEEYGYNAQLSDRISLDRSIPDYRPKKYIHLLFLLFFLLAGLYHVTVRFASLIPAAVDGFYFCEGTQCKAGLFGQETGIFIKRTAFFPSSSSFVFIALWLTLSLDIYCAKNTRFTVKG